MSLPRISLILAGAAASLALALGSVLAHGRAQIAELSERADAVLAGSGVTARFTGANNWLTRHPTLHGGEDLSGAQRAELALKVARINGTGGVRWAPRHATPGALDSAEKPVAIHCEEGVNGVLKARSLRFAEASAQLEPGSDAVIDEVATALRPCLGSVIAITGHTDAAGDEAVNLNLSQQRADAVRTALVMRGIPAEGLRAKGWGSARPLPDIEPGDAANRRIEFEVVTIRSVQPTPIDTPGAG